MHGNVRGRDLLVVAIGGTIGTALREVVSVAIPAVGSVPVGIFVINVVGACALGVLLEALSRRGADIGRRRTLRLLLGTGVLGGFTTYSALALDSALLLTAGGDDGGGGIAGGIGLGIAYGVATIVIGGLATWLGILLAAGMHRRGRGGGGDRGRGGGSGGVGPEPGGSS